MTYTDYVADGKWLVQAPKRLQAASNAAVDAAQARWNFKALEQAN